MEGNGVDLRPLPKFRDRQELMVAILRARREVAQLRLSDLREGKVLRAVKEMNEVVRTTEQAADSIMQAVEEILTVDLADAAQAEKSIAAACMRIFEACSFQDVTGQRIGKVIKTLDFVDALIDGLQSLWGEQTNEATKEEGDGPIGDAALLSGPALEGEGIDQDEIDKLLKQA
jgi:chemotaxis regulatin CheY-phosphate phosphatase CheZ